MKSAIRGLYLREKKIEPKEEQEEEMQAQLQRKFVLKDLENFGMSKLEANEEKFRTLTEERVNELGLL